MPTFVKVLQGRIIKFFPERAYGFIKLYGPGKEQFFFHMTDSRRIYPGESRPVFDAKEKLPDIWPGTEVVFIRVAPTTNGPKPVGPKALPWGLYSEWERAERIIEERRRTPISALDRVELASSLVSKQLRNS